MTRDPALMDLLSRLGQALGMPGPELDSEGGCSVVFDEQFTVGIQLHEGQDELWIYADLGACTRGPGFYAELLKANLFWRANAGATLSLTDDDPPHVILARSATWRQHDAHSLSELLKTFVDTMEKWCGELRQDFDPPSFSSGPEPMAGARAFLSDRA